MKTTVTLMLAMALALVCAAPVAAAEQPGPPTEEEQAAHTRAEQEALKKAKAESMRAAMESRMHAWEAQQAAREGRTPMTREERRALAELQEMAAGPTAQPPRVVLVPTGEMAPERAQMLTEDLAIMSRLLDKALVQALGEEGAPQADLGAFAPLFDNQMKQTLYLDGYGAVFVLSVRFPLLGPPPAEPQEPEKEPESLWDQTRREMESPATLPGGRAMRADRIVIDLDAGRPYEGLPFRPERVDQLKNALLGALREASHVRGMQPDDAVALVVIGSGARQGGPQPVAPLLLGPGTGEPRPTVRLRAPVAPEVPEPASPPPAPKPAAGQALAGVLTVCVTKRDIDACASGDVQAEDFQKRAIIVIQ
jgi:hypothetical protein